MALERDIVEKIQQTFSPEDAPQVIELLTAANKFGRIARCIVFAAKGNLERVGVYLKLADFDYRDMIVAGEYDRDWTHLRDLRVSFLIDTPQKMWISEVAVALAPRDYFLESLDTDPIERIINFHGQDIYTRDGSATFSGDLGEIHIVRIEGQWILKITPAERELFGIQETFDNSQDLGNAVSRYILAKRIRRESGSAI